MDKARERETRDFMNVESFSQLPFIRPAPPAFQEKGGGGAIRLFGKEFGSTSTNPHEGGSDSSSENEKNTTKDELTSEHNTDSTTSSNNNRKFECHYCCRNFPTSQALGGHQNAHKRERQHAKRTHLQSSSMVHAGGHHVYGLMNYNNRFGSGPTLPMGYGHSTWNGNNCSAYSSGTRLYNNGHGAYNAHHEPITGSPLALWRIPNTTHNSSSFTRERPSPMQQQVPVPVPLLFSSKDGQLKPLSTINSSSESRFGYGSKQDNVSLDLHL